MNLKKTFKNFTTKLHKKKIFGSTKNNDARKNDAANSGNRASQNCDLEVDSTMNENQIRERIRQSVECPICTDIMLDPISLDCGHTFCLHCMAHDYARQDNGKLICCICRSGTSLAVSVSRTLRDLIETAFPDEERHRRETLTRTDRLAVEKLLGNHHKSPNVDKVNTIHAKYMAIAILGFLIWFFYME